MSQPIVTPSRPRSIDSAAQIQTHSTIVYIYSSLHASPHPRTPILSPTAEMPFHQYSRLFTSGLLSEPSPPPTVDATPPQRRRRSLFLNPTGSESTKPADLRPCSFLELADSLTSPTSPTDPSSPWRPLGHRPVSYVLHLSCSTSSFIIS